MVVKIMNRCPEVDKDAIESKYSGDSPDLFVFRNTVPHDIPLGRVILLLTEPPLSGHRQAIYDNLSKFHTVITHKSGGGNVFRFGDNPLVFPYGHYYDSGYVRENLKITTRSVYYAGQCSDGYCRVPNHHHSINLYPLRHEAGDWLLDNDLGYCFGRGWPEITKNYRGLEDVDVEHPKNWRMQKAVDCDKYECDFMLSMENSMKEGYVSEKFHDPIMCDRVMLYLGTPDITEYISDDCFIDLRKYITFDPDTFLVDGQDVVPSFRYGELRRLIADMSQSEYTRIIQNAREWKESIRGMYEIYRDSLTRFIMERIDA